MRHVVHSFDEKMVNRFLLHTLSRENVQVKNTNGKKTGAVEELSKNVEKFYEFLEKKTGQTGIFIL